MNQTTQWQVEAWRGLAAWLVVYTHYWAGLAESPALLRFAFTGVDLFFVLSGWVFAPYLAGQPLQLPAYALRRFFRIYPTYFLALLVYFGLKVAHGLPLDFWWQHLVFAHVQSREMAFYYNPAFWSLPAEVEFYLALPMLAWLCRARGRWLLAGVFAALALRVVLGVSADFVNQNQAFIWLHHLPGMGVEFGMGALAWRLSRSAPGYTPWRASSRLVARLLAGLSGLALWLVLASIFASGGDAAVNASWARGQLGWLAALGFALMVGATATADLKAPESLKVLALWAGKLSYGSYLFHIGALMLVKLFVPYADVGLQTTVAAALTLLMAWAVYVWWEDPWRTFGRALARRQKTSVSPG